jgi:hypothetical protein
VVAAGVDWFVLYAKREEAAGGGLHALYSAYPPVHEWALENAAAIRAVPEVDLARAVLEDALAAGAPDLHKLVHA